MQKRWKTALVHTIYFYFGIRFFSRDHLFSYQSLWLAIYSFVSLLRERHIFTANSSRFRWREERSTWQIAGVMWLILACSIGVVNRDQCKCVCYAEVMCRSTMGQAWPSRSSGRTKLRNKEHVGYVDPIKPSRWKTYTGSTWDGRKKGSGVRIRCRRNLGSTTRARRPVPVRRCDKREECQKKLELGKLGWGEEWTEGQWKYDQERGRKSRAEAEWPKAIGEGKGRAMSSAREAKLLCGKGI